MGDPDDAVPIKPSFQAINQSMAPSPPPAAAPAPPREGEADETPALAAPPKASAGSLSAQGSRAQSRSTSRAVSIDVAASASASVSASASAPTPTPAVATPLEPSTNGRKSRTPAREDPTQSEPMTRATSTSSQPSSKDANAAVYGTRSRNRPNASRPNYAEDVEMDFESQPQPNVVVQDQEMSSIETDSHSPAAVDSRQSPTPALGQGKKAAATGNGWNVLNKETAIPGTSSFAANPSVANPSRKRKAAAVANQNMSSTNIALPTPTQVGRRSGVPSQLPQARETNMVSFDNCKGVINKNGSLVSDDGQVYSVNDHVYLVCEPPGEPYYIGRIMEFRCRVPEDTNTPVEYLRINWVYRPRDVQRFVNDSRLVYVTMHSDLCPLTSLRGKSLVQHRSEIKDLDQFRKIQDAFWFNQCFDRFIHRWYEVIPTAQVINVPENVKKALDERWKYIVLETSRVKELTSEVKSCKRCVKYCATDDSVECAVCHKTYHMNCVRPPLLKKPSRGFAWACAPCSRAQERRLEARRTPNVGEVATDAEDEEILEEEEEDPTAMDTIPGDGTGAIEDRTATEAEIAHAKMWPMRYLGIHCRVEDVLQYEDRAIYPRASSRLGPKHQANTLPWHGRPLKLVKPVEIKKKYIKSAGNKKDTKLSKETQLAIEADKDAKAKRPPWVQDEPLGYLHRGDDLPNDDPKFSAKLMFKMPELGELSARGQDDATLAPEALVDAYMAKAKFVAKDIGVEAYSTDFLDRAVYLLQQNSFDSEAALRQLKKTNAVGQWPRTRVDVRKDLRDPRLTLKDDEKKKFEEGVKKYGSELRQVRSYVRTISHADTVRYWYYWKKTPQGKRIWGSFGGRKNASKKKAENSDTTTKLLDDIADAQDDSAFDNEKIVSRSRKMVCKHCNARRSRYWRRAPGVAPGQTQQADGRSKEKGQALLLALCQRCAKLWRRYAILWEDADEMGKKMSQGGGKAWKRRVDEELIKEWAIAQETPPEDIQDLMEVQPLPQAVSEPPRKKVKGAAGQEIDGAEKKKVVAPPPPPPKPREPTPPLIPAEPFLRNLPCSICYDTNKTDPTLVSCRDCRLTVHRQCYGVPESRSSLKWTCDPCANDRREMAMNPSLADPASYRYKCVLCPVEFTDTHLVEPPRISHKKKTDREREKERIEKEMADKLADDYTQMQRDKGRPILPREPLKRTADNKWVHVTCSLWTPEIKYSNAKTLEVAEGIPLIPKARREQVCKLCKSSEGACVSCSHCSANFHIACSFQHGYTFGFDVTPVKGSRRDGVNIVTLGHASGKPETGILTAAIWCRDHSLSVIKTNVHILNEPVADGSGMIALQLFAQNYKQADLTLTGTARKASFLDELTKSVTLAQPVTPSTSTNRRISTSAAIRVGRTSSAGLPQQSEAQPSDALQSAPRNELPERRCAVCNIDVSPRWWKHEASPGTLPPPDRRLSIQAEVPHQNGIKPEIIPGTGDPMQIDSAVLPNGSAGPGQPAEGAATVVNGDERRDTTAHVLYDCNKCHWRIRNAPEELRKPVPEAERHPTPPPTLPSPPRRPPPAHHWNGLPNIGGMPSQQQLPGWAPYTNGAPLPAPQQPVQLSHHPGYHSSLPHQAPVPGYAMGAPHPHASRAPFGTPAPPPGPYGLNIVSNLPNGHSGHNGHPPPPSHGAARSPTHPQIHGIPRQADSPFTGAPSHIGAVYGHHHSSPAPTIQGQRPSTPRDVPQVAATPRIAHGASASPNVRNILND